MNVISILKKVGAIITDGHFVGTSGRHMSTYINKDRLISHPKYTKEVGKLFANKFKHKNIEVVVAPAVAGIALSQWTAFYLSNKKKEVLSVYTEKTPENQQILKRGYDNLIKDRRVLIIDDIATKGSSLKKVINTAKKAGGEVIAACVMVNRDPKLVNSKSIRVSFSSLTVFKVPSYKKKDCPLCKKRIPINTFLGHGKVIQDYTS